MLVSPESPEGPCVDAARDSMYCPQEIVQAPRAAPRGNPPTPKPRQGNGNNLFCSCDRTFVWFGCCCYAFNV